MAGSHTTQIDPERAEIEALLPWYVAGTLSRAEEERVSRYVAAHPEMAELVELTQTEREATIAGNEAIGMPSRHAFDKLMARVAETERTRGVVPRGAQDSLLTRIVNGLADFVQGLAPRQLAFAAAAALALIVAQGVTLGVMMGPTEPGGYTTASGGKDAPDAAGTFGLVRFAPGATAAAIADMLLELEAVIVDGPKAGGIYRVRIAPAALDEAAAKARLARLQARTDLVTFAALTR